jgi:hypothetical protein
MCMCFGVSVVLSVRGGGHCWELVSLRTQAMDSAAAAAAAAAEAEAKAAEDAAPKPEDVMRAFASAKVRCGAVSVCHTLGVLVLWLERGRRTIGAAAAAAVAAAAAAEAKAAEDVAPRPEDVMRAFASAKVRCGCLVWFLLMFPCGVWVQRYRMSLGCSWHGTFMTHNKTESSTNNLVCALACILCFCYTGRAGMAASNAGDTAERPLPHFTSWHDVLS